MKSPIAYGYGERRPAGVLQPVAGAERGGGGFGGFGGGRGGAPGTNPNAGIGQNVTPNARAAAHSAVRADAETPRRRPAAASGRRPTTRRSSGSWPQQFGITIDDSRVRASSCSSPANPNDMLLSGTLANGQSLANRAAALDEPLGKGHVVMFAIRPFWRWQTQGTYTLGFNAIMNWNDLDAGKAAPGGRPTSERQR